MSVEKEQFEKVMGELRLASVPASTADVIQTFVDAQGAALSRVEAERDTAIVQMQNIRKNRDRLNKEQCDTEFTLCIAQQQLAEAVGLLRYSQEIARLFDDEHTAEVGRFLARHVQAEQQEAHHENA